MKRFRTVRRTGTRKRAIWVNIPFGGVNFSETAGEQLLLLPEDWEASFTGLSNERAVLRAIVGQVVFAQTVAGTAGNNIFWGLYMSGLGAATPVFTTTGMSDVSWLRTGVRAVTSVVTNTQIMALGDYAQEIEVKAKRKLDSSLKISLVAQYGADAAAPLASCLASCASLWLETDTFTYRLTLTGLL